MKSFSRLSLMVAVLMMSVACTSTGGDPGVDTTAPSGSSPGDTSSATTPDTTAATDAPDGDASSLAQRLGWFVDTLNSGTVDETSYAGTFTAEFQNNVSYGDFATLVSQISEAGTDWSLIEYEERDDSTATVLVGSADGQRIRVAISLETALPYRIEGLLVQPADPPTLDEPPADVESAVTRLAELGDVSLLVADVSGGSCDPVYETNAGVAAPVGSAFKLYVLGAVADEVAAGNISWDDDLAISDGLKSIPTGVLQNEEAGTEFSVREFAEAMIALSDNTATDHLIDLVGRERVEKAFADYGMTDPAPNIPLLDTLDLSALKVGPASGLATQWLDADEAGRRQILAQISDITPADIPVEEFVAPIHVDQIEWFATPTDMCRALTSLYDLGDPVTKIMTINPGVPAEDDQFEFIAFKGGSEPGLISMNWLVERSDGRRFAITGSVVNTAEEIDQLEATLLFAAVRDLVADLP